MSEPMPAPDHPAADQTRQPTLPQLSSRSPSVLAGYIARISVTQLTLAVIVIVFTWQWLDSHRAIGEMQQQLAKKIAEMDGNNKASQMLLAQNQDQMRELLAKVSLLESRFAEAQNQRAALEALYNDLSASRDETALADVEQMLLIAAQQLQLSANVKAALIAMQSADMRLQRMDRAAFNGLRHAIGRDMDKLRALPNVDMTGVSIQLNTLIALADQVPLSYQQRTVHETLAQAPIPKEETAWHRLGRELWQEFRQLVRIENTGKAEIPLLPPSQEFFLRENFKLRLFSARLALLSHDENSFGHEIKTAQDWNARYFDGKSGEGTRMQGGLGRLAAIHIGMDLPDIGSSLQAVRNYRLSHENEMKSRSDPPLGTR